MSPRRRYRTRPQPAALLVPIPSVADLADLGYILAACLCDCRPVRPPQWRGRTEAGRIVYPRPTLGQPCEQCGAPLKRVADWAEGYVYQPILRPTLRLLPRPWPLYRTMWEENAAVRSYRRGRDVA